MAVAARTEDIQETVQDITDLFDKLQNCLVPDGPLTVVSWIDEAEPVYHSEGAENPAGWRPDVDWFRNYRGRFGSSLKYLVFNVDNEGWYRDGLIIPEGESAPAGITVETTARDSAWTVYQNAFLDMLGDSDPGRIVLNIDSSGSMNRHDIWDGYCPFFNWLIDEYGDTCLISEYRKGGEQWLRWMGDAEEIAATPCDQDLPRVLLFPYYENAGTMYRSAETLGKIHEALMTLLDHEVLARYAAADDLEPGDDCEAPYPSAACRIIEDALGAGTELRPPGAGEVDGNTWLDNVRTIITYLEGLFPAGEDCPDPLCPPDNLEKYDCADEPDPSDGEDDDVCYYRKKYQIACVDGEPEGSVEYLSPVCDLEGRGDGWEGLAISLSNDVWSIIYRIEGNTLCTDHTDCPDSDSIRASIWPDFSEAVKQMNFTGCDDDPEINDKRCHYLWRFYFSCSDDGTRYWHHSDWFRPTGVYTGRRCTVVRTAWGELDDHGGYWLPPEGETDGEGNLTGGYIDYVLVGGECTDYILDCGTDRTTSPQYWTDAEAEVDSEVNSGNFEDCCCEVWWVTGDECEYENAPKPYYNCQTVQQVEEPANKVGGPFYTEQEALDWKDDHCGTCEQEPPENYDWYVTGRECPNEDAHFDYYDCDIIASDTVPNYKIAGPYNDRQDAEDWKADNCGDCGKECTVTSGCVDDDLRISVNGEVLYNAQRIAWCNYVQYSFIIKRDDILTIDLYDGQEYYYGYNELTIERGGNTYTQYFEDGPLWDGSTYFEGEPRNESGTIPAYYEIFSDTLENIGVW